MELEIKHIAPYLPYELSVQIKYNDRFIFQILRDFAISDLDLFKNQIKPILRPMSDLYKQIENDIENEVTYIEDLSQTCCNKIEYEFIKSIIDSGKLLEKPLPYWTFKWFFKNHFDIFGLIEKGIG